MEMNQNEQHAAEQLDRYINASQRGKRTEEVYPFVDQLFAMAKSIEAGPTLGEKVKRTMDTKAVVYRPLRWVTVAAAIALLLTAFLTVPALRSFASNILTIFAVHETDENPALQPTAPPPVGVNPNDSRGDMVGPNPSWGLTLEQVEAQVAASSDITFDLVTPSYLPTGFSFDAGMVDEFGRMVQLIYVSADHLSLAMARMYDLANPNPAVEVAPPLGASSTIETVTINGHTGQYVQGDYGVDGLWDSSAPVQTLAWQANDVLYIITTHEQGPRISQADLIRIAESLTQ
jgi:hypothetical protein